ncbi:MAG: GAF domain-containing protein [Isosphaeraceae bacterium]
MTLWRFQDGSWTPGTESEAEAARRTFDRPMADPESYQTLLRSTPDAPGLLRSDPRFVQSVVAARLPDPQSMAAEVVIVGRPGEATILSRARADLTDGLMTDFLDAYRHAQKAEATRDLVKLHSAFTKIVSRIAASLGDHVVTVHHVLKEAAQSLRVLYKRAMISLVDPTETRLEAVVERSIDRSREAARRISYALDGSDRSGHVWVVQNNASIVADASHDERCHRELADDLDIRGVAIVPLTAPGGKVLGALAVEPLDGRVPSSEEAEVVANFARQLAAVILSARRVAVLFEALDSRPESVAYFDSGNGEFRLRYANKAADRTLKQRGWFPVEDAPTLAQLRESPGAGALSNHLQPLIENAFQTGQTQTGMGQIPDPGAGAPLRRIEISAYPIKDHPVNFGRFRRLPTGVVCQIRIDDDVSRMFSVIEKLAASRSRVELIEPRGRAPSASSASTGRLYLIQSGIPLPANEPRACRRRSRRFHSAGSAWLTRRSSGLGKLVCARRDENPRRLLLRPGPPGPRLRPYPRERSLHRQSRAGLRGGDEETPRGLLGRLPAAGRRPARREADARLRAGLIRRAVAPRPEPTRAPRPREYEFLRMLCELTTLLLKSGRLGARREGSTGKAYRAGQRRHSRLPDTAHRPRTCRAELQAGRAAHSRIGGPAMAWIPCSRPCGSELTCLPPPARNFTTAAMKRSTLYR